MSATRIPRFGSNVGHNMIGTLDDEVILKGGGAGPAFDVNFSGFSGSTYPGDSFTQDVVYTASPTGQTNARVTITAGGTFVGYEGDVFGTYCVIDEMSWVSTVGWTIDTDWTPIQTFDGEAFHTIGFFAVLTTASLGTSGAVCTFGVSMAPNGSMLGYSVQISNAYSGNSHTDTAISPVESVSYPI